MRGVLQGFQLLIDIIMILPDCPPIDISQNVGIDDKFMAKCVV